jgi:hypothetical protein
MTHFLPKKYSLQEINEISFNGFICVISPEVLGLITELNNKVGSSSYIKTPIFNKRNGITQTKIQCSSKPIIKDRKKKVNLTEIFNDDDWDLLNSFEPTKIEHKEGFETLLVSIRSLLNMMTEKTFQDKKDSILNILKDITSQEEINKIFNLIFEIASGNKFYSEVYSNLFVILIEKYSSIMDVLNENLKIYMNDFKENKTIDLNNYDELCKMNKDNEKIESMSLFISNLTKKNIIEQRYTISLVEDLFEILLEKITDSENKLLVDKIIVNISILYNKEMSKLYLYKDNTSYPDLIMKIIQEVSKNKYPGLTNKSKSLFTLMDIMNI